MKKKTETKAERKDSLLAENALELNDADLEGAAGGIDGGLESAEESALGQWMAENRLANLPNKLGEKPVEVEMDPEQREQMMEKAKELEQEAKRMFPWMK